ncbi:MAG TPA: HAMP domain-containing sensor histidine kinase [Candidatus Saccharimonadales bacterium]|nr:HAMP domain-containing sensor histidine kinase [Candidatus Saccharimonadales bacterium]
MPTLGFLKRSLLTLAGSLLVVFALPHMAAATPYGVGAYGSCSYKGCAAPTSTQTTTPSGLQISVNLVEGQSIPSDGYTIVVTPLNGAGSSFTTADFYINGQLIQSVTPDETGTARWFWDPQQHPGNDVKIVVTDGTGATATQEFHVTVQSAPQPSPTPPKSASSASVLQKVYTSAKKFVANLPKPVVYSFPYILLVLLGANVALLLLQTWRELKGYRELQAFVARERTAAEAKTTLMELIAHYFRTPLTILLGGIDMIDPKASGPIAASMKTVAEHLRVSVEQLLGQTRLAAEANVTAGGEAPGAPSAAIWRQPGLIIPLILIAVIIVPFDLIVRGAQNLNLSQLNVVIQVILYAFMVLTTYQVFRRLQLRRRERRDLQVITTDEQSTVRARDELLGSATSALGADIAQLDQLIASLPPSQARDFIVNGQTRFHDLLTKLAAASQLRGGHASEPPQTVKLSELLARALQTLSDTASKRGIKIEASEDVAYTTTNPELLAFVLRSLLDNAVAYSKDNSVIRVDSQATASGEDITVTDTGSGIPAEKMALLFQPFSRAEGAEVFTHEGMGFSLYLDNLIMTYLGGTISLDSELGRGTVVHLHVPAVPEVTLQPGTIIQATPAAA